MDPFLIAGFIIVVLVLLALFLCPSPLSWIAHRKLQAEIRTLREHLHTKMEIDAKGLGQLKDDYAKLKNVNENLRVRIQTFQNKPGRAELRLLHIYDRAINTMLARTPGFAPVWQVVLTEAETEMQQADRGIRAFVTKVFRPSAQVEHLSTASTHLLNRKNAGEN